MPDQLAKLDAFRGDRTRPAATRSTLQMVLDQ